MTIADPIAVATVAFWILVSLIVVLPIRWSVVVYLLLVQFDLAGSNNYFLDSLGIVNAIRVIGVPTLLLLRVRPIAELAPSFSRLRNIWLLYAAYAAIAVCWSPYRIPAIKMLGYFYAYSILFLVFTNAWQRKWFNTKSLALVVWLSLLFGMVQTYMLGNQYGNPEYEFRFTSFTGAQSFAPFLLCLLVVLLFRERWNTSIVAAAIGASVGLVLTGSRSIFFGFSWIVLVGGFILAVRSGRKVNLGLIVKRTVASGTILFCVGAVVFKVLPESRLNEVLGATVAKDVTLDDVGTFAWRYHIYQKTLQALAERSLPSLFVGSGTSSGASLVLEAGIFKEDEVDPNRSIHDEFLRSLYEWGVPGIFLLALLLAEAGKIGLRMATRSGSWGAWAFLAIFVPMLISLTFENILAEGGGPAGVGYSLVLTSMAAAAFGNQRQRNKIQALQTNSALAGHSRNLLRPLPEC